MSVGAPKRPAGFSADPGSRYAPSGLRLLSNKQPGLSGSESGTAVKSGGLSRISQSLSSGRQGVPMRSRDGEPDFGPDPLVQSGLRLLFTLPLSRCHRRHFKYRALRDL